MLEPWQKQGVSSNRGDALTDSSSDESPPQPLLHDDLDLLEFDNDEGETPLPTPWWRHRWVPIVSGVVLIAVVASIVGARMASAQKATTYQYGTVRQGNLALTVSGTGPVSANLYNLSFATSGTIAEIDVSVGQTVKAGQTLAKLDPTALRNAVSQAQLQAYIAYDQEQQALDKCNSSSNPPVDCV
jgi:hypothetical protein